MAKGWLHVRNGGGESRVWIRKRGCLLVCIKLLKAWDGAGGEKRRGSLGAWELGASSPCAVGSSEKTENLNPNLAF